MFSSDVFIKQSRERKKEDLKAEVVELLSRIFPDQPEKMEDATDVVHRGETCRKQIIILFAKGNVRDEAN